MGTYSSGLVNLENAIAQNEGFFVSGSVPQRNNNPGDLFSNGQVISFPSAQAGWQALEQKLANIQAGVSKVYSPDMSLNQFAATYTGGDPNAAANIASSLGGGTSIWDKIGSIMDKGNAAMSSGKGEAGAAGAGITKTGNISQDVLIRGVSIVAGIVLIAGAVFGFDSVKETVVNVAKSGAELAA